MESNLVPPPEEPQYSQSSILFHSILFQSEFQAVIETSKMPRQKARRHNSGTSDRSLPHRTPAGNKSHWLIKHTVDSHHNIHCVRLSTTLSTRPDLQIQTNCNTHQHKASTMKLSPILPLMMSIIDPSLALLHPPHQPRLHLRFTHHTRQTTSYHRHDTSLAYKPSDSDNEGDNNVWTVLANTERWISDTLEKSNRSAASRNTNTAESKPENEKKMHFADEKQSASAAANNPYARKEVTYACETAGELAGVVGGVFRRVREARELGERHGRESLLGECVLVCCQIVDDVVVLLLQCRMCSR